MRGLWTLFLLLLTATPAAAETEGLILSGRDPSLAITAWGGVRHGVVLRLSTGCQAGMPECSWSYRNGMLVNTQNPRLAINAWDGARHGTVLKLHENCQTGNPDCTWTYRNGMFVSDRNPSLAINAWDGARHGIELKLHADCRAENPDCNWRFSRHAPAPSVRPDYGHGRDGGDGWERKRAARYELVKASRSVEGRFDVEVVAQCPYGSQVVGGGADGEVQVLSSRPTTDGRGWQVVARSDERQRHRFRDEVVALAVCRENR